MSLELEFDILGFKSQDEIYDFCDRVWAEISYCNLRFNRWTSPYILSTEFPWLGWPNGFFKDNTRVLTIAGSGDVPLFFQYCGVTDLIAVDVSYHACMWNELKRCLVRSFDFKQIRDVFFGMVSSPEARREGRNTDLFHVAMECMSNRARKYWTSMFKSGIGVIRKFLRPSDSLFTNMAFYLSDELIYQKLRVVNATCYLYNLPFEVMLNKLPNGCLDFIYCSNFIEYLRVDEGRDFLDTFRNILVNAKRVLVPDGVICFYETSRESRVLNYYSKLPVEVKNLTVKEIIFRPRPGFVFKHCLVFVIL